MRTNPLPILLLLASVNAGVLAQENYDTPLTEWGVPDLQGVWNFSSNSPMLRPAQFGTRQYLTPEEIEEINARLAAQDAAGDAALNVSGVDESYNDFWIERAGLDDAQLTSHVIYPENGRLPELQPGARTASFMQAPDRPVITTLGINFSSDGPEDRSLSDRCIIGFNAGPPIIPSFYNNGLPFACTACVIFCHPYC